MRSSSPLSVNARLNELLLPMMSVPMRNQFGARFALRIQACWSDANGVPGDTIGRDPESQ